MDYKGTIPDPDWTATLKGEWRITEYQKGILEGVNESQKQKEKEREEQRIKNLQEQPEFPGYTN